MEKINDGGPAFPNTEVYNEGIGQRQGTDGMTLRDYFAAHAPKPPQWFAPEMPDVPKKPEPPADRPDFRAAMRVGYAPEADGVFWPKTEEIADSSGKYQLTAELKAEVEAHVDALNTFVRYSNEYRRQYERQVIAQWPWAYAKMVMDARPKGGK